ncbi:glycosyltransferase family 2 protein [Candidatus Woesearchaeota archaeon]|nr:glycosyltransferase family 2 protein [Candidatus Woesearchaeota archaeon]RLE42569.1 MAG: glycosyltransferase family 2 protein [Candidatus Woesearchaeota archaeon]
MYKGKSVALVIPARNEEKLIRPTLEHVPKTVDKIYVIDDGSTDNTAKVVREIAKKDKRITLLQHEKNLGPGYAIITGYKRASADGYDIAVVIGGDYQMDLRDLPNFLEPLVKGEADYTKGNRFLEGGFSEYKMPLVRLIGNSALTFITKMASGYWKLFDTQDGYTAITKEAIDRVNWDYAKAGYGYVSDFLITFSLYNIRVKDVPRRAIYRPGERQSQIKILKYMATVTPRLIRKFFWRINKRYLLLDFHPLVLFYYLAFIMLPMGLALGVKILFEALHGPISGNQVVLTALLLIMGTQFLLFAILFDMEQNS